jgi:hypothetical protein
MLLHPTQVSILASMCRLLMQEEEEEEEEVVVVVEVQEKKEDEEEKEDLIWNLMRGMLLRFP